MEINKIKVLLIEDSVDDAELIKEETGKIGQRKIPGDRGSKSQ